MQTRTAITRPFTFQMQLIGAEHRFFALLGQEPEI